MRACSKPRPKGFVTPTTCRMSSPQRRAYLARTVASETPSLDAIARNDSRPFAWRASMIPWSSPSIRGGALIGPRRGSATAGCAIVLRKARRFVPRAAHSVNASPYLNSHCECWMLRLATIRGGAEVARTPQAQRIEDAWAEVVEGRTTRRELVKRTAVAGAALAGAGTMGRFAKAAYGATQPQIAILGAGLAGLTCAYRLKQAGLNAQLYEASDRVGGRCYSIRDFSPLIAEHGGELIDQGHTGVRQLAQDLGLNLDNLLQGQPNGTEDFFWVNGGKYPYSQLVVDLNGIYQKLHKDVSAASYPTLWNLYTQRGWELDHMSIIQWLDETVPNDGSKSNLGRVLDIAYNIEYGAESSVQSSLNLLYLLGYRGQGQFRVFGDSNEKYHVRGGNDQIPQRLAAALSNQISLGTALTSIKQNSGGSYTLTLSTGTGSETVMADH